MSEQPYSAVPRREGDIVDTNPVHEVYGAPPMDLPHGAGQPRFLGQAANNDLSVRNSFADSQYSFGQHGSEYGGSTYALNTQPYSDDPNAPSRFSNYQDDSVQMRQLDGSRDLSGKSSAYAAMATGKKTRRARWGLIVTGILIVLLIAVLVPIYFLLIKPKSKDTDAGSDSSSSNGGKGNSGSAALATSGGDGSNVVFEDGSTMKYTNSFSGQWYYDINDPYKSTAQAQSYTPSIDKTFEFGKDRVYGVNIGGWLVTEPFIVPALYQKFHDATPKAVDEWTLMQAMGADKEKLMKEHYETFITEKDFAEIAAAGLNFVRIPVGWWAIEVRGDEPFVAGLSWTYFLKAVGWARKYGLRVNLDLHAMPGSQNGWNHSGRLGTQNFLLGPMGYANAQRGLDYIRILAEWASQDQYKDVVVIFGITNEPQGTPIGQDTLSSYYLKAYDTVRTASGTGAGAGPWVSFHDGFFSREQWKGFLAGADRIQLDDHPYMCFGGQNNNPVSSYANTPCESWGQVVANSMGDFGMTHAGEFSLATTDCGLFLNGVDLGVRYEGTYTDGGPWPRIGSCDADVTNWEQWSDSLKKDYQNLAMASMDALQNWFFWAWKIGNSTAGRVETPHWSYQLGYENGWLPKDPRTADGYCKSVNKFTGTIAQSGSGTIPDDVRANLPWPPKSINSAGDPATLPQYTPTGTLITLKGATPSITGSVSGKAAPTATKSVDVGSGWKNSNDNAGMMVEKTGCSYLDPWVGPTAAPPATC